MKKALVWALIVLMLVLPLASCGSQDGEKETEARPFYIIQDKESDGWQIVRSDTCQTTETKATVALRKALKEATGRELPLTTDWTKEKNPDFSDLKEILVGATNRPESKAAKEALGDHEFVITLTGNKLVIVGDTEYGTQAAIEYLIATFLKYDAESKTYGVTDFSVPEGINYKGTYEIKLPDGTVGSDKVIYLVQKGESEAPVVRKDSTTPDKGEAYVTPHVTYNAETGQYESTYDATIITGDKSTFQTADSYNDSLYFRSDAVMCYVTTENQAGGVFSTWMKRSNEYSINMMMALNRDNGVYVQRDPSKVSDIQTRQDGSLFIHSGETNYYMVPTKDWIEYIWEVVSYCVKTYNPDVITFEEPEMWYASGYSDGFKDEWYDYYGTNWVDQTSSPEAMYRTMELKTYLFERILTEISDRIHKLNPNTKIHIATHSTVSYAAWQITPGLNTYMATGVIDGVIGQTWSDTANSPIMYKGSNTQDCFMTSFIDYASYLDAVEGSVFYALSDPMADGKDYTELQCQKMYRQTLVASIMQPEVNRFQMFPWPSRSFLGVSSEYRSMQLGVFNALEELAGKEITMSSGTTGISYLLSDSIGWERSSKSWCIDTGRSFYGFTYPLANDGIRTTFKSMEKVKSAKDLEGIQVLVVAYDCQKPKSAEVNKAIAEWVKQGGTVLYLAGKDDYETLPNMWWSKAGSPLQDLINQMGLNITVSDNKISQSVTTSYTGSAQITGLDKLTLTSSYSKFYISFTGADVNPILTANKKTIGIDQAVGKGHFIAFGIPAGYLATIAAGDTFVPAAVAYALQYEEQDYVSTNYLWIQRGNVYAGHAIGKGNVVKGNYINLFDESLPVVDSILCPANDSVLLYDISKLDVSVPRVGFTGGMIQKKDETANKTTLKITGPTGTYMNTRFLAPVGTYPQSVTAVDSKGMEVLTVSKWDEATSSLLVKVEGSHDGITLTVNWGTTKTNFDESMKVQSITMHTNSSNEDEKYIYSSNAGVNDDIRFCDGNRQLIYKFDTTEFERATFSFQIYQNYILEFSFDRSTWYVIADYSLDHEFTKTGGNMDWFSLSYTLYSKYQGENQKDIYVRLRSTDVTQGWGGSICNMRISWMTEE